MSLQAEVMNMHCVLVYVVYPTAIGSEPQDPSLDSSEHWERCMVSTKYCAMYIHDFSLITYCTVYRLVILLLTFVQLLLPTELAQKPFQNQK